MSVKESIKRVVKSKVVLLAAVLLVLGMVAVLIFIQTSNVKVMQSKDYTVTQTNAYSDTLGVSMSLNKVYLSENNQIVAEVMWKKTSLSGYTYGDPFTLYTLIDGEWKPCTLKDNVGFHALAYGLIHKKTHLYHLSAYIDELKEGTTYKLDTEVFSKDGKDQHIGVEFVVNKVPAISSQPTE